MPGEGADSSDPFASVPERVLKPGREREHPGRKGAGGTHAGRARKGAGRTGPRTRRCTRLPSPAWAGASREPGPFLWGLLTCSPAGTARCTSSSCSASRGLSRRAGPSAAARSLPAPGPARSPVRRGSPGSWCRRLRPLRSLQGPSAAGQDAAGRARAPSPLEPPGLCASVRGGTATPARPQDLKSER